MEDYVTRANIDRFERMVAAENDPKRREALLRLLEEERGKLQGMANPQ